MAQFATDVHLLHRPVGLLGRKQVVWKVYLWSLCLRYSRRGSVQHAYSRDIWKRHGLAKLNRRVSLATRQASVLPVHYWPM